MRTTVDIPEELLEEARRVTDSKTMRETIILGLQELVNRNKRQELRKLAGKIHLNLDLSRSRRR